MSYRWAKQIDEIGITIILIGFITFTIYLACTTIFSHQSEREIITSTIVIIEDRKIFDLMTNVDKYPQILPGSFLSVNIINKTSSTIFAEEEVTEAGIRSKLLVKHLISPYNTHTLEVMSGDAKGTIVTVTYDKISNSSTKITTDIKLTLHGPLSYFISLTDNNITHAIKTVIYDFVNYAQKTKNEK